MTILHVNGLESPTAGDGRRFFSKRRRTGYAFNASSFAVGDEGTEGCHVNFRKGDLQLTRMRDLILYHTACRVGVFTNQLFAYWNEGCRVTLAPTMHQNGQARCGCCQAAHFSILPNVRDTFIPDLIASIRKEGLTFDTKRRLALLRISDSITSKGVNTILQFLQHKHSQTPRLFNNGSFLYSMMNDTVKMSAHVNEYDCLIEGQMRPVALWIINTLSGVPVPQEEKRLPFNEGEELPDPDAVTTPWEGVNCFVEWMHSFFRKSEATIHQKLALLQQLVITEQKLFSLASASLTEDERLTEVLDTLHAWSKIRSLLEEKSPYAPRINISHRLPQQIQMVDQILLDLVERQERIRDPRHLDRFIQHWLTWAPHTSRHSEARKPTTHLGRQQLATKILTSYSWSELSRLFSWKFPPLTLSPPLPTDRSSYPLHAALVILQTQQLGTIAPKPHNYTYHLINGQRHSLEGAALRQAASRIKASLFAPR